MKIRRISSSVSQGLMYATIEVNEKDYLVITYPIGYKLELKDKFVHIREMRGS